MKKETLKYGCWKPGLKHPINNVACPFCGQIIEKADQLANMSFRKMMPLIIEILRLQGFEIRKIRKDRIRK